MRTVKDNLDTKNNEVRNERFITSMTINFRAILIEGDAHQLFSQKSQWKFQLRK